MRAAAPAALLFAATAAGAATESCSAWAKCSTLAGDCCPASNGQWLSCCCGQKPSEPCTAPGPVPPPAPTPAPAPGTCKYDAKAALSFLSSLGCSDDVASGDCPGHVSWQNGCTDAQYVARALAAAGVVQLQPGTVDSPGNSSYAYNTYKYNGAEYKLDMSDGLMSFLAAYGFSKSTQQVSTLPAGSIVFFNQCNADPCFTPCIALGTGNYTCHSVEWVKPHCNIVSGEWESRNHPMVSAWTC